MRYSFLLPCLFVGGLVCSRTSFAQISRASTPKTRTTTSATDGTTTTGTTTATTATVSVPAGTKVFDPPYMNQIYLYMPDSLMTLEETKGEVRNKMKALGFGGSETAYVLDGGRSPIRVKAADQMRFTVKTNMGMNTATMDPATLYKLYRLDPDKSSRKAVLGASGAYNPFSKGHGSDPNNGIAFHIQKSGNDVYIFIPDVKLAAGEYGFMSLTGMSATSSPGRPAYTFYAFGVDQ